jgi:hypothetical protein
MSKEGGSIDERRPFTGSKNNPDDIDIERGQSKEGELS